MFFPKDLAVSLVEVLEAVGRAGMALAFAAPELRNDREAFMADQCGQPHNEGNPFGDVIPPVYSDIFGMVYSWV